MTRQFAGDPEVAAGTDEPRAKHLLPETVDGHSRRERMVLQQQPLREAEPVPRRRLRKCRQDFGGIGLHFVHPLVVFAAAQDIRFGHLVLLMHHMGHGAPLPDLGLLCLELGNLRNRGLEWLVECSQPPRGEAAGLGRPVRRLKWQEGLEGRLIRNPLHFRNGQTPWPDGQVGEADAGGEQFATRAAAHQQRPIGLDGALGERVFRRAHRDGLPVI